MTAVQATCARCGIRRSARYKHGYFCGSCRPMLQIEPSPDDGLPDGRWVIGKAGVARFEELPNPTVMREHQERIILRILSSKKQQRKAA